jgi:hypothetical protein
LAGILRHRENRVQEIKVSRRQSGWTNRETDGPHSEPVTRAP